ncbi:MAG: ATP-binding cassette domain-containing protein [candidate division Zixibacteria bacterium]|nr:ATP-binding cassette domain-containing protein [candidate division Zixibacteria bacterium]
MNYAIEINGLTKKFDSLTAINTLDLKIKQGEMFGLVGPDGAGKTTLIRILCGIIEPDEGDISILGYKLDSETNQIKRRIGYLSQKFSLYGDLSIDENIEFFADIHQVADYRQRREELLEFTRLTPFRDRLADRLSGGMKQKLALACTLIHTPAIIFLDEPTTGVDPVSRRDFWKILSELLNQGITIIMTTPYLDEAERCSKVGMINRGELMAYDTPDNVKAKMDSRVLEIVCYPARKALHILKDMPEVQEAQAFGDRVNVFAEDTEEIASRIKSELESNGVTVSSQRVITPSLENVFISLMQSE